jgi:hypothetical protein
MQINGGLPFHIARAYALPAGCSPAATATGVRSLVAASVERPINLEGDLSGPAPADGALQLYTRAADKVEATVAVMLGRTLDVTA